MFPSSGGHPGLQPLRSPVRVHPMATDPHHSHKWNSLSATGGIGWDIGVHRDRFGGNLVLRPIANVTLGTVASDLRIRAALLEHRSGQNLDFLDGGNLNVYGLGGSLMLDYELFSAAQDIDAELRFLYQHLQSFTGTAESVSGQADAENLGLYLRRRAPWHWTLLDGPSLRWKGQNRIPGAATGLLGFNSLNSLGLGLELDSSKYDIFITRTQLVARYMFTKQQYQRLLHRTGDEFLAARRHEPSPSPNL